MHHLKEFSIELELTRDYWTTVQNQFPNSHVRLTSQSSHIYEAVDFHKTPQAKEMFAAIEEYHKDKFPVGSDRYLSGGVHLHTWAKKSPQSEVNPTCLTMFNELYDVYANRKQSQNTEICKTLISKFKNSLLFCKLYKKDDKLYFFSRPGMRSVMCEGTQFSAGSKCGFMTMKSGDYSQTSSYASLQSIEWRLNNVISDSIGAYYLAIMLSYQYDVNLKNIKETWRSEVSNGIQRQYTSGTYVTLEQLASEFPQNAMSEENREIWESNMCQLYSLLYACGYDEEAQQFKDYLAQYGVTVQLRNFLWTTTRRKTCLVTTMTGKRVLPRIKKIVKSIAYTGHIIEHVTENGMDILRHNNWETKPTRFIENRWTSKTAYVVYEDEATKKRVIWSNRLPGYKITHLDNWVLRNYNDGKEEGFSGILTFKNRKYYLYDKMVYELIPNTTSNPHETLFGPVAFEGLNTMQYGTDMFVSENKLGFDGVNINVSFLPTQELKVERKPNTFKVYTIDEFRAYQETIIGKRKTRTKKVQPTVVDAVPAEVMNENQERLDFSTIPEGDYQVSGVQGTYSGEAPF